jgi:hypothetical protein
MFTYIYIHLIKQIYIYIYICIYIYNSVYVYIYTYKHIYVFIYIDPNDTSLGVRKSADDAYVTLQTMPQGSGGNLFMCVLICIYIYTYKYVHRCRHVVVCVYV